MNLGTAKVDALDCFDHLTVQVQLTNVWRLRLGLYVLRLATWILQCSLTIELSDKE
jgi:hypothetical protein